MDEVSDPRSHNAHEHGHGGHAHAVVDHLASDDIHMPLVRVALDPDLMNTLHVHEDDLVLVTTDRGRTLIGRVAALDQALRGRGVICLDRFGRQSLKAHLNEEVRIESAANEEIDQVVLRPGTDVSLAHDLTAHFRSLLIECRTPVATGAVLYMRFPGSQAGTTYEVAPLKGPAGYVGPNTRILIDQFNSHVPEGVFDVTFEDVGGLSAQVRMVRELVQLPLRYPEVYRHLGITPPRGVILYGPPGSGKTHLARAVSNEVDARFYYLNGPDVIGTYTGETEANLRRIFSEASHHAPSIIFIDELDAIAPKRGETGSHSDTRAVTQLLSLMDGLKRVDSVVVLATTNRVDSVDTAFRRPGRFDRELFIGAPDAAGRREILTIHTREMPLSDVALTHLEEVARRTHGFLGADLMELCREAGLGAMRRHMVSLSDHRSAFQISASELRVTEKDFDAALGRIKPSSLRDSFMAASDVSWSQIGGLSAQKKRLQDAMSLALRQPEFLHAAGLSTQAGVLLHGPSGVGKTMIVKALANESGVNFISVNGPEIFTKWLGESEEAIREVFRLARQVAPAIIFFDQLEAIAPVRGSHEGSMTTERVVSQLLAQLDALESGSQILIVGATNRVELIDPSVVRTGRFGQKVFVPMPDEAARREILAVSLHLPGLGPHPDVDSIFSDLAEFIRNFSGAEIRDLCDRAKLVACERRGFAELAHPDVSDFRAVFTSYNEEANKVTREEQQ
ncbi:MAG: AAA family ATPase [Beijerinckiaceae bacterium]|nr:AAA family ATPase [Beijerinckiaceae bacterium]